MKPVIQPGSMLRKKEINQCAPSTFIIYVNFP